LLFVAVAVGCVVVDAAAAVLVVGGARVLSLAADEDDLFDAVSLLAIISIVSIVTITVSSNKISHCCWWSMAICVSNNGKNDQFRNLIDEKSYWN
jgi:hypothetical protein